MFTFLACQTHFRKIGANIIKSGGGGREVLEGVEGEQGRGWGAWGKRVHHFTSTLRKCNLAWRRTGSWVGASEGFAVSACSLFCRS